MTTYEKAKADHASALRRTDQLNFWCGVCVGVMVAVVAMVVL